MRSQRSPWPGRSSSRSDARGHPGSNISEVEEKFMIKLKVNGKDHQFSGDPEMPLLWFLRDEINLKGTKFGCGFGMCGACTVHLNGKPARACLTPVSAA